MALQETGLGENTELFTTTSRARLTKIRGTTLLIPVGRLPITELRQISLLAALLVNGVLHEIGRTMGDRCISTSLGLQKV
jgi:hypothetical protein